MTHRIVQIIPTLDRGGAEKQLVLLAAGLDRNLFETHVVLLTREGPLLADLRQAGVPTTLIGKRGKLDPVAYFRLVRLLKRLKPDLVQTWLFAANAYGRAAALAAKVPVILGGERSVDPWKRGYEFFIDRQLAKRTRGIVTNSSGVKEFYVEHGLPADTFEIIPNGIECAEKPAPLLPRERLEQAFGIPPGAHLIAAVGRLWPQKRIDDLIWAADLLKVIRNDVHLLIIGDGPLRGRLLRFRKQVCIEDKVHFLGERSDVRSILPHCTCLWLGSGYEGLPNSVMEAMAAGIPVVATDIPGTRDLVVPEVTGLLVPVGSRADIARATRRLLDNPEQVRQWGAAGKERILREFSRERMLARYTALYQRLLA